VTAEGSEPISAGDSRAQDDQAVDLDEPAGEREFFNYPGPLFSALISPSSVVMKVNAERGFRCVLRDKSRRTIEQGAEIRWTTREGLGRLSAQSGEIVRFTAPQEPGLCILEAVASQGNTVIRAEATITVSESLMERETGPGDKVGKGLEENLR